MTAETIRPDAIDSMVPTFAVRVLDRHRRDLGDVRGLAESIRTVGLLHPIVLTRAGRLVAGQRRLAACMKLGWQYVPVRFVDTLDDAALLLGAERDENLCRKDMLPSEKASMAAALERQLISSGNSAGGDHHEGQDTRDLVGQAIGMSGRTYQELRFVYEAAFDPKASPEDRKAAHAALAEMDTTGAIAPPARRLRARLRPPVSAARAVAEAVFGERDAAAGLPLRSREALSRRDRIRELATEALTSDQIGGILGISALGVRRIARQIGITIPADDALGARTRRTVDSNRVVRETVTALEGLAMGVGLVHFDTLDRDHIEAWTTSLAKSIRVLSRLNRQLKEMAQ
jgi:hypothetical protein